MPKEEITPIRKQYLDVKKQYPDAIVFFRLGDFYETFDRDAEIASKELEIVLTSRNIAKDKRVPMAGIPYHAVDSYLAKLIDKGYHVAICEQIGDQPAKGLVPRKVVRVVTPGTVFEPDMLEGEKNNYLAGFIAQENKAAIAHVDITTGDFLVTEITRDDVTVAVRDEFLRLRPAEILYPENYKPPEGISGHFTPLPAWKFDQRSCYDLLLRHFNAATLDGFGLREKNLAIQAAGAIVQYLEETQPSALKSLTTISTYNLNDFMTLDAATLRNLEIIETIRGNGAKGSLLNVLDQTISPMGQRLIRQWIISPLLDLEKIQQRQEGVTYFVKRGLKRAELRDLLSKISDLERLTNRIVAGNATPRDLLALRYSLQIIPSIKNLFTEEDDAIASILQKIHPCSEELDLLQNAIADDPPATLQKTGVIKTGFSEELDQVIQSSKHAREWISGLETIERKRTGIKNLKVGFNKVFGYFIEITRSNTDLAPQDYIRKQTLVNAERYITPELKEYESLVLNAEEVLKEIENRVFHQVCSQIALNSKKLMDTARMIAHLDVLASLAETAAIRGYQRPELTDGNVLEIHDSRHPVVEEMLGEKRFVPNDVIFDEDEVVRIITGPNMSGKSTFLRQVALIVLMAQMGSYVPAESARIGLVDRIFTRIGAQDEIFAGQSTFMVEMVETANILHHATRRSLLVLDEIGRGTSTYDGVSIAWAVVEYIHNHPKLKAHTLFATHYHELTQLSEILPGVKNYNVAVTESENKVIFLHKIIPGGSDRSYGIHVAEMAGLPPAVVHRASEILTQLEASTGRTTKVDSISAQQMNLFPETNPLLGELKEIDVNSLSPIEALNKLYEMKKRFLLDGE
jgi:DNA mismatch repair protein MutS